MKHHRESIEKLDRIAHALIVRRVAHGISKAFQADEKLSYISSIGTERTFKDCLKKFLKWRVDIKLPIDENFRTRDMQEFLYELEEESEQKQLDVMRQALQSIFGVKLSAAKSQLATCLEARAYSLDEVSKIESRQSLKNRLSTAICFTSGCRAHELYTLRPASELPRSGHRPWRSDLHCLMDPHEIYTVQGKGGLSRHIAILAKLVPKLESRRISHSKVVVDRGIEFTPQYDIGGGQAFSQSFSSASDAALGYSSGAHGLRHSYVQNRFRTLKAAGISTEVALLILSQEMGHFRPSVTLVYLR